MHNVAKMDEEGDPRTPKNNKLQSIEKMREDFREHNFIWTQWKRPYHFTVMKRLAS